MPKAQLSAMSPTFKPSESQLLWKKDPRFVGMTITKARESVNRAIRELVTDLVGKPPAGPFLPHHKGHPISSPQIGVGKDNYQRIGSYYVMCQPVVDVTCRKNIRYYSKGLVDEFLMLHEHLTPLLLMREELQPVPRTVASQIRLQSRSTICNSQLYNDAIARFYLGVETIAQRSPLPITNLQELPTPPRTLTRAGPSHQSKQRSPSDISSPTPSFYPFERNTTVSGAHILHSPNVLDPDSDDNHDAFEQLSEAGIIEITSDSDQELVQSPFLVVVWTMDHCSAMEAILYCDTESRFCLKTYELELKNRGISLFPPIESYNPMTRSWDALSSREWVEPILSGDGRLKTFLLRYQGVKSLPGFDVISPLAHQLVRKGKARAM